MNTTYYKMICEKVDELRFYRELKQATKKCEKRRLNYPQLGDTPCNRYVKLILHSCMRDVYQGNEGNGKLTYECLEKIDSYSTK